MASLFWKTFGGFRAAYYFRHLFFGFIFLVVMYLKDRGSQYPFDIGTWTLAVITTLLYPYSRFVYESVVNFLWGHNETYIDAGIFLFLKLLTMTLCWFLAIGIAPIGLTYLYFHHSRQERQDRNDPNR